MKRAPEPPLEHSATSAPGTWQVCALAAELLHAADDPLELLGVDTGVAEGHGAAVGGDRERAPRGDVARLDERPALAHGAEAVGLQLADDLEGERVVELGYVDVGRPEARPWRRRRRPLGPRPTLRRSAPSGPAKSHTGAIGVRRAEAVAATARGSRRGSRGRPAPVGVGQDQRAAALGRHGAVEQVERLGDQR